MKKDRVQKGGSAIIVLNCFRMVFIVGFAFMLALFTAPLIDLGEEQTSVWAAGHSDSGGEHGKGSGGKGTHGKKDVMGQQGGAKDVKSKILSADEGEDDSDRPDWAQGNRELNPHAQGGGQPSEAGIKKGDMYGDLWIILRDDVSGLPIYDVNGYVQPLVEDESGVLVPIQLTDDGELPPEYADAVMEVEFGRLSVGRSPSKVTEHALDEAISKLQSASTVELDLAGRIIVDGATIDSPLENLALYIALMTDDPALQPVADKLENFDSMTLASSLFAAAADKTGTIGIDVVAYQNVILGIAAMTADDNVDYSSFDYNRNTTYSGTISYYVQQADGTVVLVNEPILQAVFDGENYVSSDGDGITDFSQAADDALQMIEFIHTQIHEE